MLRLMSVTWNTSVFSTDLSNRLKIIGFDNDSYPDKAMLIQSQSLSNQYLFLPHQSNLHYSGFGALDGVKAMHCFKVGW